MEPDINKIIDLYNRTHSLNQIYKQFGVCYTKAVKILSDNGIKPLDYTQQKALTRTLSTTEETSIGECFNELHDISQVSKKLNIPYNLVRWTLKRLGLRTPGVKHTPYVKIISDYGNDICNDHKNGLTIIQLSRKYNVDISAIRRLLNKNNCLNRTATPVDLTKVPYNEIYQLGVVEKKTKDELCKHFNVPLHTIYAAVKAYNLQLLTKSERTRLVNGDPEIQRYRITQGFRAKPYTLPSGNIIKIRGFEGDFLDHIFNNNIINETDIDFKPTHIDYTLNSINHKYIPDFYIPKYNIIIEIKSKFTLNNMKDKNNAKRDACISKGFNFMFIIDKDYTEFDMYIQNHNSSNI